MPNIRRPIYLHGFASGPASKKARYFQEKLAQRGIELEIPDLAAGDFEHLTISGQLGMIEHAAKGQPVWLIGSSLGGYLAALYASRHPEVEKLVLMAPAFCFATCWAEVLGSEQVAEWKRTGSLSVFHHGEGGMRKLGYQLAEDSAGYPELPQFSQPALILHGSRDSVVPAKLSEEFAAGHANVRLRLFDSDHELADVLEPMWVEMEKFLFGMG